MCYFEEKVANNSELQNYSEVFFYQHILFILSTDSCSDNDKGKQRKRMVVIDHTNHTTAISALLHLPPYTPDK